MTITTNSSGTPFSFVGEKAVDLFRIRVLRSALKLLKAGIQPTRGYTLTKGLQQATEYTGNTYKRTEVDQAIEELGKIEANRLRHIEIITQKE